MRLAGIAASILAVALAGCGSEHGGVAATDTELQQHVPVPVAEYAAVAAVEPVSNDERGDTRIRTDHGNSYYISVGTAPVIKTGDTIIVKSHPETQSVSISVNDKVYSGSIAN